ncbi:MAG TPA: hypothetical protein VLB87_15960 [Pyrinomonadaceae bacterium]|nr:hypothetical protein [Pyrinomonadaceae bacterium]
MKTYWKILAGVFATAALVWFFVGNMERAFLAAVAAAIAWFLSYRTMLREKLENTDNTDEKDTDL